VVGAEQFHPKKEYYSALRTEPDNSVEPADNPPVVADNLPEAFVLREVGIHPVVVADNLREVGIHPVVVDNLPEAFALQEVEIHLVVFDNPEEVHHLLYLAMTPVFDHQKVFRIPADCFRNKNGTPQAKYILPVHYEIHPAVLRIPAEVCD